MSKINDLREKPTNSVNLVDFYSLFCPDEKPKYLELLFTVLHNKRSKEIAGSRKMISDMFDIPILELSKFDDNQLSILVMILLQDGVKNLDSFKKFIDYNERGVIINKDITKYKTFDEIDVAVTSAEQKVFQKELEKEVKMIYEDDDWVILRPLTYLSSKKYGAHTKWCTASEQTNSHFTSYTQSGALIYSINKKKKLKVATYQRFDTNKEITFWDEKDNKVDCLSVGLPFEILKVIKCDLDTYPVPNSKFVDEKAQEKINKLNRKERVSESVSIGNTPWQISSGMSVSNITGHSMNLGVDYFLPSYEQEVMRPEQIQNSLQEKLVNSLKTEEEIALQNRRGGYGTGGYSSGSSGSSGTAGTSGSSGSSGTAGTSGSSGSSGTSAMPRELIENPNTLPNFAKTTAIKISPAPSADRVALKGKSYYKKNKLGIKESLDEILRNDVNFDTPHIDAEIEEHPDKEVSFSYLKKMLGMDK